MENNLESQLEKDIKFRLSDFIPYSGLKRYERRIAECGLPKDHPKIKKRRIDLKDYNLLLATGVLISGMIGVAYLIDKFRF